VKKLALVSLFIVLAMGLAMAQTNNLPFVSYTGATTDVLGAHLGYGRGCVMCHAPHSGAGGNGVTTADSTSGNIALWGQDLNPLYKQTLTFAQDGNKGAGYAVVLPASGAAMVAGGAGDPTNVIIFCLSCHDGNLAKVGMMQKTTVEVLPIVGGHAPTLLGADGTTAGNYGNDHPVGINAQVGCGGQYNWDCVAATATAAPAMTGPNSTQFVKNYGFAVSFSVGADGTKSAVTCTSCHDQHSQNIYAGKMAGSATTGYYPTMFFLRGYYQPGTGGNNAAQFCRQCHGGEANESKGQYGVVTN
jgi:hypothetical protein